MPMPRMVINQVSPLTNHPFNSYLLRVCILQKSRKPGARRESMMVKPSMIYNCIVFVRYKFKGYTQTTIHMQTHIHTKYSNKNTHHILIKQREKQKKKELNKTKEKWKRRVPLEKQIFVSLHFKLNILNTDTHTYTQPTQPNPTNKTKCNNQKKYKINDDIFKSILITHNNINWEQYTTQRRHTHTTIATEPNIWQFYNNNNTLRRWKNKIESFNILISAFWTHIVKLLSIKLKFYQKWLQAVIFKEPLRPQTFYIMMMMKNEWWC